jgi:hypothetical protein
MADLHVLEAEAISPDLVQTLEEALAKAKAGELSSVAIAVVYRSGCINWAWSTPPSFGLLLGAVHRMAHRMNLTKDEERD